MKRKSIIALAKRKRQNDRIRAQTVRKYQKEGSGDRVKVEPDYDFEEDDEDLESQTGLEEESLQQRTRKLFVDFVLAHDVVITTYQ
jgi:E3 ubiquitin-protein ligase SHPRH